MRTKEVKERLAGRGGWGDKDMERKKDGDEGSQSPTGLTGHRNVHAAGTCQYVLGQWYGHHRSSTKAP